MGTTLTGLTPATTYDALLKTTDNGILTSSLKVITDGLGNNSALSLATTSASITGTLAVSSTLTASNLSGTNTGDETSATIKSKLGVATTSTDGYLTSTDWTTFNAKVGGSGTTNYVPKFSAGSTIANSQIFDNGTRVGIGTTSPSTKLDVNGSGSFSTSLSIGQNLSVGTSLEVNGSCLLDFIGDGEYLLRTDSGYVSILGQLRVNFNGNQLTYNGSGLNIGSLPILGATTLTMGGALSGATDITGSGKLQIANIGASGTLNVGSTTTATKRLELTADNNSGENNTLRFVDTDTTSSANQVIGKIEFFSSDVSAPSGSVKAYISAQSLDTTPDAYLDFATDTTTGTPIVRQRIQADGKILIGTTTAITGNANLVQVNGGLDHNIIMRGSSGTAITLGLNDKGSFFEFSGTSAISVTIPTNASVPFPIGTQMWFVQTTVNGIPTFSGDTGVTLRTRSTSRQPFARYSEVKLTKVGTDEWYLTGDLKA